jgi:hypothetical protein
VGDQSKLNIYVKTDYKPSELEWILEIDDGMGGWDEVEYNPLPSSRTQYYDAFCLEPDSTYRWTINDTYGDGILVWDPFSVSVNGEEIFDETGENRWRSLNVVFVTPSDPTGSVLIITESPSSSPTDSPSESSSPSSSPSASFFPSSNPTEFFCDTEEDILNIEVTTDYYYYYNDWYLDLKNETTQEFENIATKSFSDRYTTYVDNFCLIPGRSYKWTLTDYVSYSRKGNGLNCDRGECGYSVKLNGEEIVKNGKFFDEVVKEIGPVECVDELGAHRIINPKPGRNKFQRMFCKSLRKLMINGEINDQCTIPLLDGSGYLYDKCKNSCGAAGLGPCAE